MAGQITALKFYRSSSDTGTDIVHLWSSTGTMLASATFSNTTASGWQTVNLTPPVAIAAKTTYVVSYHTNGVYVATDNYFTSNVTSGVLTAPSSTTSGGNGVYAYGGTSTTGIFPTSTFSAANYWVDVVFSGDPDTTPETPTLSITNPSLNVTAGGSVALGITATPVDSDDILSVQISGLPSYETITAPTGNTVSSQQQGGTTTWTITESSSTTGAPLTGLTLSSSYTGTDHPVATLTVTASNTTSGETANSAPQTIMVTDPPATTLASATGPATSLTGTVAGSAPGDTLTPTSTSSVQTATVASTVVPDPKRQRNPNRRHQSAQLATWPRPSPPAGGQIGDIGCRSNGDYDDADPNPDPAACCLKMRPGKRTVSWHPLVVRFPGPPTNG